jgi:hypothetical protein
MPHKPTQGGGEAESPPIDRELRQPLGIELTPKTAGTAHSGGASSPLLPALIGVAVLAAISIGSALYRQRRRPSVR